MKETKNLNKRIKFLYKHENNMFSGLVTYVDNQVLFGHIM